MLSTLEMVLIQHLEYYISAIIIFIYYYNAIMLDHDIMYAVNAG